MIGTVRSALAMYYLGQVILCHCSQTWQQSSEAGALRVRVRLTRSLSPTGKGGGGGGGKKPVLCYDSLWYLLGLHPCGLGGRKEKEKVTSCRVGQGLGARWELGGDGRAAVRNEAPSKAGLSCPKGPVWLVEPNAAASTAQPQEANANWPFVRLCFGSPVTVFHL